MSLHQMMHDTITVHKLNNDIAGPYKSSVQGDKIYIVGIDFDGEEGDKIIRQLPNGREETTYITNVDFINHPRMSSYTITTRKNPLVQESAPMPQTVIFGSQGIQIGNHNTQNIIGALDQLIQDIDNSNATPEEKKQAKSKLKSFIEHPLTSTVLGIGATALIASLG